jgi:hypothetical protein
MLEIAALVIFAFRGFNLSESWTRILWALLLPLLFAAIWGIFAVRNDPSRSGKTVIATPGKVRLLIELLLFSAATGMISGLSKPWVAWVFGASVIIHYLTSYDRLTWLLKQR